MSRAFAEAQAEFPELSKEEILELISPVFEPDHGRTKQSFKDQTNINKIMERATRTGSIAHVQKYAGQYGDFADLPADLLEMYRQRDEVFEALPGEIKREFKQNPAEFFRWASEQPNQESVIEELKKLAPSGDQRVPNVVRTAANMRPSAASAPQGASITAPIADTGAGVSEPQEGSGEG